MHDKVFNFIWGLLILSLYSCNQPRETVTILAWPGYEEADIVQMIKEKVGSDIDVNFITYIGGEEMLKKYKENKEHIDLIVADAEYGKILFAKGEIQPLEFESSRVISENLKNYYPRFLSNKYLSDSARSSDLPPGYDVNGNPYCLIIRWGTVGIVADTQLRNQIDTDGYRILSNSSFQNKMIIFDWYLPNMGIFSLDYMKRHKIQKNPYDLNEDELEQMYTEIMIPVKKNIKSFHSDLGMVIKAVYDKDVEIVPGIGEWAIGNDYLQGNQNRTWYIPQNEKAIIWIESLAIPKHIVGHKRAIAMKILELFSGPEMQQKLAWRKAYTSQVPNRAAYELMDGNKRAFLRYNDISQILANTYYRKVPDENNLPLWLNLWTKFKN